MSEDPKDAHDSKDVPKSDVQTPSNTPSSMPSSKPHKDKSKEEERKIESIPENRGSPDNPKNSTLNPNAKEFVFNPNAKSFTPVSFYLRFIDFIFNVCVYRVASNLEISENLQKSGNFKLKLKISMMYENITFDHLYSKWGIDCEKRIARKGQGASYPGTVLLFVYLYQNLFSFFFFPPLNIWLTLLITFS